MDYQTLLKLHKLKYQNQIKSLQSSTNKFSDKELLIMLRTDLEDLDYVLSLPKTDYSMGIISSIVKSIVHIFTRLFNNFRAIITSFYKDVKRSELEYFVQSYPLLVKKVDHVQFFDVNEIEIPYFPFKQKPPIISKDFESFYKKLDIKKTSKDIYYVLDKIISDIIKEKDIKDVKTNMTKLNQLTRNNTCKSIMKYLITNVIVKPSSLANKFEDIFDNIKDFVNLKKTLLTYETNLYNDVTYTSSMLDKCDKILTKFEEKLKDDITDYIVENKQVIKKLSELLYQMGYYFETIGTYSKEVNHLSHFVVNVYKTLDEKI